MPAASSIAACLTPLLFSIKLLADAHRLEIHAEDIRHPAGRRAIMAQSVDLVEDGLDLEAVIALDIGEAVGPSVARDTAV